MRGYLLSQLGKKNEAKLAYLKCIEIDPNHALGHLYMAEILVNQFSDYSEAKKYTEKSLQLDAYNADAHNYCKFFLCFIFLNPDICFFRRNSVVQTFQ